MIVRLRNLNATLVVVVALAIALTGCANMSVPAATETVLEFNVGVFDAGVAGIASKLKTIPVAEKEKRRPYIEAAAVLEKFKKINNSIVDVAVLAKGAKTAGDLKAEGEYLEALDLLDQRRRETIGPIIELLVGLGVAVFK